jgi:hypothetical protein
VDEFMALNEGRTGLMFALRDATVAIAREPLSGPRPSRRPARGNDHGDVLLALLATRQKRGCRRSWAFQQ